MRFQPSSETNKLLSLDLRNFSYNDYLGQIKSIKIQILTYQMEQIQCTHLPYLPVSYDHIKEAVISNTINDDIDVSIIISKTQLERYFSLIRIRYHNVNIVVTSQ